MQSRGDNEEFLRRVAGGGEITDPAERQVVGEMLASASADTLHRFVLAALRSASPGRFGLHAERELNALSRRVRGDVAATLVANLLGAGRRGGGLATTIGGGAGSVLASVHGGSGTEELADHLGLSTTAPAAMSARDLAALATYAQANNPDALARVVAQFREYPEAVRGLLGEGALRDVASGVATTLLGGR